MKLKLGWIAAGLLAFLFFLVAYLPANQVVGRLTLPNNTSFTNVSGTVWTGSAGQAVVNGVPVKHLEWSINPWALLMGQLSLDVKAGNVRNTDDIAFSGPLSISLFNTKHIQASQFVLYVPASYVVANVSLPFPVQAGGRLKLNIQTLDVTPLCMALNGKGDWLNASVSGTQGPIELGNYEATLSCNGENIAITVEQPNLLGLSLSAMINPTDFNIDVEGQFKVDPSLPQEVHIASQLFGQPNTQGYTEFKL